MPLPALVPELEAIVRQEARRFLYRFNRPMHELQDVQQDAWVIVFESKIESVPGNASAFWRTVIRRRLRSLFFSGKTRKARELPTHETPETLTSLRLLIWQDDEPLKENIENRLTYDQLVKRFYKWRQDHSFTTRPTASSSKDAQKYRNQRFVEFSKKVVRNG